MSRQVGLYRSDFLFFFFLFIPKSNDQKISTATTGNDLKHVANVLGRRLIFLLLLTVTNKTISDKLKII